MCLILAMMLPPFTLDLADRHSTVSRPGLPTFPA
jgi:hypothetical protein